MDTALRHLALTLLALAHPLLPLLPPGSFFRAPTALCSPSASTPPSARMGSKRPTSPHKGPPLGPPEFSWLQKKARQVP